MISQFQSPVRPLTHFTKPNDDNEKLNLDQIKLNPDFWQNEAFTFACNVRTTIPIIFVTLKRNKTIQYRNFIN